ncbi:MAG: NAD(P)-dependent oxidoreductase [Verrucomicrobiota bacterium]
MENKLAGYSANHRSDFGKKEQVRRRQLADDRCKMTATIVEARADSQRTVKRWPPKYAWQQIARSIPPKRSVAERLKDSREIYALYDETTAREQASRCIQCPKPLCMAACPLHNRIPEWLALTAEGRFIEASEISCATSNMPEICSRVCPQERLCEGGCILNGRSEPVCIGAIEKFINEYALAHHPPAPAIPPWTGHRVAVVGSGPGGIACADELAKRGHKVTMFETQLIAGGLLMNGIPGFKLEKQIVQRRLNLLLEKGVSIRTGICIGRDVSLDELQQNYDAIYLAIGAQKPKPLDVPGAGLSGVHQALPFLIDHIFTAWPGPTIPAWGKRVVVLGGGDTAMDCLRTALRDGALEAVCLYRRDLANMPGSRREYANALEEGAQFQFLTNPIAVLGNANDEVTAVRCVRMELGEPDASGRRKPRVLPNSEFVVPADLVLVSYGFDPVPFPRGSDFSRIEANDWGAIVVDKNQMTSVPGVFAGGDMARGPSLVVHAVRDGRVAAEAMHRYLTCEGLKS